MARRRKSAHSWVADFETVNDPNDCRVWSWAATEVSSNPVRDDENCGIDIESFLRWCMQRHSVIYFHNASFDSAFIIDRLFRDGLTHNPDRPLPGEFTTLIDKMGKFYSMGIHWRNGFYTEIRDSLKRIPMSVKDAAKTYNLPIAKGEIDYRKNRPVGYLPTFDEWDYQWTDVEIVAMALHQQESEGMSKLTVGSDALDSFKAICGDATFKALFPQLTLEVDGELRLSYRGGFTYSDKRFSMRVNGKGNVYDVNSLYPFVMYTKNLPYGEPEVLDDIPSDKLWIASFTIKAKLKKKHIPCIQIKGHTLFSETEYLTDIDEPTDVVVTSIDWALWNDHYDIDVFSVNGVYGFQSTNTIFRSYVEKWSKVKENSEGGRKAIAKLFLNSLYGKFGTNPDKTGKHPEMVDNKVKLVLSEEEFSEPIYVPMASFITAYARDITIRAAQAHYDQFAYADTDSLHLLGAPPTDLDVHPTRLGAWKHEYAFTKALWARAKAYTELRVDGGWETHIAGLPRGVAEQVRFGDYFNETRFEGKLLPVRVPGGIVLQDIAFQLKMS